MDYYKIIYTGGEGEIVEKKSRFIATIRPVATEEEAVAFINETKKKYWDARHNCSAFVIGNRQELSRCSDDGEPAQTAGRPMLDVLLREGITNAVVVVTRYFGGVLLGTGGLVRAYQSAVSEGLQHCVLLEKRSGMMLSILSDYNAVGKLQYLFVQNNLTVMDSTYSTDVLQKIMVPAEDKEKIQKAITEATNGSAHLEWGDTVDYGVLDKEVILL